MNEELCERIYGHLCANDALMASELAHALKASVEEVRDELRLLIVARRVQRMHCGHGILRYRAARARPKYHDCVTREDIAARPATAPRPRRIGGIDVDTVLADINVLAGEPNAHKRLVELETIGARLAECISNALIDVECANAEHQGENS
jgi:hypothetical protein